VARGLPATRARQHGGGTDPAGHPQPDAPGSMPAGRAARSTYSRVSEAAAAAAAAVRGARGPICARPRSSCFVGARRHACPLLSHLRQTGRRVRCARRGRPGPYSLATPGPQSAHACGSPACARLAAVLVLGGASPRAAQALLAGRSSVAVSAIARAERHKSERAMTGTHARAAMLEAAGAVCG
jgi:hypothetical protein